jgi:hypothetical protein
MDELSENEYMMCRIFDKITWGQNNDRPEILMKDIISEFPNRTPEEIGRTLNRLKKKGIVTGITDNIISVNKTKFNRFY